MHKLAELCVRRPVFATMLVLSLTVVGAYAPTAGESHPNCVWTTFCNH